MRVVAAVLAGGQARRFGADKLRVGLAEAGSGGVAVASSLGRVVAACRAAGLAVSVVGGPGGDVADAPGVEGPLGGLLGAMRAHPEADILLLAGDLPRLTAEAVAGLVARHAAGALTGVACVGESGLEATLEPLATIYPMTLRGALEAFAAAGGRSLRRFLAGPAAGSPRVAVGADAADEPEAFRDFDTPAALEALGLRREKL